MIIQRMACAAAAAVLAIVSSFADAQDKESRFSDEQRELFAQMTQSYSLDDVRQPEGAFDREVLGRLARSSDVPTARLAARASVLPELQQLSKASGEAVRDEFVRRTNRVAGELTEFALESATEAEGDELASATRAVEELVGPDAYDLINNRLAISILGNSAALILKSEIAALARESMEDAPPIGPFSVLAGKGKKAGTVSIRNRSGQDLHHCVIVTRVMPDTGAVRQMAQHEAVAGGLLNLFGASEEMQKDTATGAFLRTTSLLQEKGVMVYVERFPAGSAVETLLVNSGSIDFCDGAHLSIWCDEGSVEGRPVDNWPGSSEAALERVRVSKQRERELSKAVEGRASRTWRSTNGFETVARYVAHNQAAVTLEKDDGARVAVPFSVLSEDDRKWVERYHGP